MTTPSDDLLRAAEADKGLTMVSGEAVTNEHRDPDAWARMLRAATPLPTFADENGHSARPWVVAGTDAH
jgi:hypothetical protein